MSKTYKQLYREIYAEVFEVGGYRGVKGKIRKIAQMVYNENKATESKEDCALYAYELYEEMTGHYIDPTHEELQEVIDFIK